MVVIGVHVNLKVGIHSRPFGFISVSNLVYTLNCGRTSVDAMALSGFAVFRSALDQA
jgi:hypothetical protein